MKQFANMVGMVVGTALVLAAAAGSIIGLAMPLAEFIVWIFNK